MSTHSQATNAVATHAPAYSAPGLEIYFQSHRAGLDAQLAFRLAQFIEATRESLDCAIYDLRHPDILAALQRVHTSGKRLRIAFDASQERTGGLDGDPKPGGTEAALEAAGLGPCATPIKEHGRHLMHDKFLIRDGRDVWSGSANFTVGGLELQDNNCFAVTSPDLAARYDAIFAKLLSDHPQAHERPAALALSTVAVGDARITPAFAPAAGESIEGVIVSALKGARRVRMLAFLISDPGILAALAAFRDDPRADIRGVYDPHGMEDVLRYTKQDNALFWFIHDPRFVKAPSHAFAAGREQDFMHNKTLIVDDHLVITGSYNFSENAEANDENLVSIASPAVAEAYTAYFDALYAAYGGTVLDVVHDSMHDTGALGVAPAMATHSAEPATTPGGRSAPAPVGGVPAPGGSAQPSTPPVSPAQAGGWGRLALVAVFFLVVLLVVVGALFLMGYIRL